MAKEPNRSHIAIFRGRVTLLPLPPFFRNRRSSSYSRLSFPEIPRHRYHSTYFLYLLPRCRLLPLELNEHQGHLPLQEQNQQLLLPHRLSPDSLRTPKPSKRLLHDEKNTHQILSSRSSVSKDIPEQTRVPSEAGDQRGLNSPLHKGAYSPVSGRPLNTGTSEHRTRILLQYLVRETLKQEPP